MLNRALIVAIIIVSICIAGVIGYTLATTDEPPAAPTETPSKTFRLKELEAKLQQVNDAIATNQEEIFKVTDEINILNACILSAMSRMQQRQSEVTRTPIPGFPGAYSTSDDYYVRQEGQSIAFYNEKIAEKRWVLKELQAKQLKLQEERDQLLLELAKLGR
jgi:hypothetical protein